jgi:D-glycero-D-manno-heptose 1,7-bisphosphate phosphatase
MSRCRRGPVRRRHLSLCRTAIKLGYRLIVVTNQAGIARGYYTEADFHTLMDFIQAQLRAQQIELDAVYHCPTTPSTE